MNILAICGSLRKKSTNMGLLRYAQANAPEGSTITIADLSAIPFYNADLSEKPAAVITLLQQIGAADALDWASREPENALLNGKAVALMGAGGGMGTSRAQYHLRQVCVYLNLHPLNRPEVFANAFTPAFDSDGNLVDEKIQGTIKTQLAALISWAAKLK
jgi:chromate reductase